MYEIHKGESPVSNIFAGDFPCKTAVMPIVEGEVVRKHTLVAKVEGGTMEATKETVGNIVGIAAETSTEAGVVVYLTGEFQEIGILWPDEVTPEDVRDTLRGHSIFIK